MATGGSCFGHRGAAMTAGVRDHLKHNFPRSLLQQQPVRNNSLCGARASRSFLAAKSTAFLFPPPLRGDGPIYSAAYRNSYL